MEILFFLVPISLLFSLCALAAFAWSVYDDQYQDLDRPAEQLIFDDIHEDIN